MEPSSDLFPQVFGPRWLDLDDAVRRFHETGVGLSAAGTFCVRRGNNRLARLLATLGRMPRAADAVAMQLVVARTERGEEWRRSFGGHPLVSWQALHRDGWLLERMGPTETQFRMEVEGGAMAYYTRRVAICLGPLRVPIPRWFAPRITAWERAGSGPDTVSVSVEVRLPVLGLLISYEGAVRVERKTASG